jgi:hypothetical protein
LKIRLRNIAPIIYSLISRELCNYNASGSWRREELIFLDPDTPLKGYLVPHDFQE